MGSERGEEGLSVSQQLDELEKQIGRGCSSPLELAQKIVTLGEEFAEDYAYRLRSFIDSLPQADFDIKEPSNAQLFTQIYEDIIDSDDPGSATISEAELIELEAALAEDNIYQVQYAFQSGSNEGLEQYEVFRERVRSSAGSYGRDRFSRCLALPASEGASMSSVGLFIQAAGIVEMIFRKEGDLSIQDSSFVFRLLDTQFAEIIDTYGPESIAYLLGPELYSRFRIVLQGLAERTNFEELAYEELKNRYPGLTNFLVSQQKEELGVEGTSLEDQERFIHEVIEIDKEVPDWVESMRSGKINYKQVINDLREQSEHGSITPYGYPRLYFDSVKDYLDFYSGLQKYLKGEEEALLDVLPTPVVVQALPLFVEYAADPEYVPPPNAGGHDAFYSHRKPETVRDPYDYLKQVEDILQELDKIDYHGFAMRLRELTGWQAYYRFTSFLSALMKYLSKQITRDVEDCWEKHNKEEDFLNNYPLAKTLHVQIYH